MLMMGFYWIVFTHSAVEIICISWLVFFFYPCFGVEKTGDVEK